MLPLGAPAPTEDWLLAMPLAAPLDAMLPKRLKQQHSASAHKKRRKEQVERGFGVLEKKEELGEEERARGRGKLKGGAWEEGIRIVANLLPDPELGEEVRGSPRRPAAAGIEAQLWRARRRWLAGGGAGRVAGVRRVRVCHSSSECFSPAG